MERSECPQHGPMYFELVKETDGGAVRRYYCGFCEHSDTFEVRFAPKEPKVVQTAP